MTALPRPFLLAALLFSCAVSAAPADPAAALDATVRAELGPDFNGVVLLRPKGQPAVVRAYGLARLDPAVPNGPGTRYQIGSASKWITTIAVLRLVDQGKLALDAPIKTWLPELNPETGAAVTLRHLLSNTSGVPNGVIAAFRKDASVGALPLDPLAATLRFGNEPLAFAPGSRWDYSVTNWVLVAAILERVDGASFADVIAAQVLRPAGATATGVPAGELDALPDTALAYTAAAPRKRKTPPNNRFIVASGSLYASAQDLVRIADAVYEGSLLSPGSRAELLRVHVAAERYALGGGIRSWTLGGQARTVAYESGTTGGFKALLAHVPGEGHSVVVFNNTDLPQADLARAAEALLRTVYP